MPDGKNVNLVYLFIFCFFKYHYLVQLVIKTFNIC